MASNSSSHTESEGPTQSTNRNHKAIARTKEVPPLFNHDESKGEIVLCRLYSIPLTAAIMCAFVERNCPEFDPTKHSIAKVKYFSDVIGEFIDPDIYRQAHLAVPFTDGTYGTRLGIVIGSNKTQEDLDRHKNGDLVTEIHRVLDIDIEPGWYNFIPSEWL
ncbi:hypothetical protein BKA70DRAFT_40901 [Coprinopsis sp. MPI-PUGE-AT-0042]|nr:hypothetical protein BKA70DRAFT_40901 [Coprinopsis sp. MPI-PUGE-AT-0042]